MVLLSITSISFQQFSLKTLLRDGIPHSYSTQTHQKTKLPKALFYKHLGYKLILSVSSLMLNVPSTKDERP